MIRTAGRIIALGALVVAGCAGVPKSQAKRSELESEAQAAMQDMMSKDPSIQMLVDQSAGYLVFPEVKKGGFIVGGAGGNGVVYQNGRRVGFAELGQASLGAQIGGQRFAQMIIVRDQFTLDQIKAGKMNFGANASAIIIKSGAAAATRFGENGVAVIVNPLSGAMVSATLSGQQIKFRM